ncbi:MAG: NAD(P)H-binding protein [Oscillatoriales cyanobacterium SM2_2_1]|nr:NAD(P)H-binding protein [Oscillatoriales cyanobacterium SM2_2_1]
MPSLLIVGATGTLGRQIARYALDQGMSVRCMVRSAKNSSFLKQWGAELVQGDLCRPETLLPALENVDAVIDAATTRPNDSRRLREVDWQGKVNLIQAMEQSKVAKLIFLSILKAEHFPQVPLMEIKACTERFLSETNLNYTILKPCGFYQNLINEYALPILEEQTIWIGGETTPVAYMNTQDIAKFAVKSIQLAATERQTYAIAGPKAWLPRDIVRLCERQSGRTARTAKMPTGLLRFARNVALSFEWGWGFAERMAYADVSDSGMTFDTPMAETYDAFGMNPDEVDTLETYLREYFSRLLKRLKELEYKEPKVKSPF